jgi:hypothetical protein
MAGESATPPLLEARHLYRWTAAFSDALVALRTRFAGDLDQHLLYMVFVQAEMARGLAAVRRGPKGLNALSVAEICGIPRETARRKLGMMTAAGLLHHGPDGLLYLSGVAP